MRVLVTGGTGHVGLNVVHTLREQGHEPIVLVRDSSPVGRLPAGVETVVGDVTKPTSLDAGVARCEAIAHLAAVINAPTAAVAQFEGNRHEFYRRVNVGGTRALVELADEHRLDSFVHTSTLNAYPGISDDDSAYVQTKAEADAVLLENDWDLTTCSIHPSWVIGRYDYQLKRYPRYRDVASNLVVFPPLYSIGRINFVNVRDMARNVVAALEAKTTGHQLVTGSNVRKRAYMQEIAAAYDGRCYVPTIPLAEYTIPAGIDILHHFGLVPYDSDHNRVGLTGDKGVVPKQFQNESLVEQTPPKKTVAETVAWYDRLGLM